MNSATYVRSLRNLATLAVSLLVLFAGSAFADSVRHDTKFKRVPSSKLEVRAIEYDGNTNGVLKIQIKNPAKEKLSFTASGLYFVPEGDPDKAPQRLGAVGPIQLGAGDAAKEVTELEVAAGETVEVSLDVFCIDSHRPSPSPKNVFNVGTSRLPKQLASTIEKSADAVVRTEAAKGTRYLQGREVIDPVGGMEVAGCEVAEARRRGQARSRQALTAAGPTDASTTSAAPPRRAATMRRRLPTTRPSPRAPGSRW